MVLTLWEPCSWMSRSQLPWGAAGVNRRPGALGGVCATVPPSARNRSCTQRVPNICWGNFLTKLCFLLRPALPWCLTSYTVGRFAELQNEAKHIKFKYLYIALFFWMTSESVSHCPEHQGSVVEQRLSKFYLIWTIGTQRKEGSGIKAGENLLLRSCYLAFLSRKTFLEDSQALHICRDVCMTWCQHRSLAAVRQQWHHSSQVRTHESYQICQYFCLISHQSLLEKLHQQNHIYRCYVEGDDLLLFFS
jgi:hypothetical protein